MEFTEYDDQLRDLGKRYLNEGTQACEHYVKAASNLYNNKTDADKLIRFAQDEGLDYAKKIFQCNVNYYLGVLKTGLGISQKVFESEFNNQQATTSSAPDETVSSTKTTQKFHTELHFIGKQGDMVTQAFVIANNQKKPIDVSFEISEFVSADKQTETHLPVSFTPSQFKLELGQEQIVECQVSFSNAIVPNQPYQAIARVIGYPDMLVRLVLNS